MRRRVLMVLLWLAGTFGATSAVFATVTSVSNDLFDAGNPRNAAPPIGRGPFGLPTTTTAAPEQPETTTAPTEPSTTVAETTTTPAPPSTEAPVVTEPVPADTTAPRGGTTVRTTATVGPPVTTSPAVTVPPTTEAPVVTEPPTTPAPPTTAPVSCNTPTPKAVGRNVIFYRSCTDGLRYSNAVSQSGWTAEVTAKGPPSVSVTFSNGSTTLTCTLTADGDGVVSSSGDC